MGWEDHLGEGTFGLRSMEIRERTKSWRWETKKGGNGRALRGGRLSTLSTKGQHPSGFQVAEGSHHQAPYQLFPY
jgi:hypothetical protein